MLTRTEHAPEAALRPARSAHARGELIVRFLLAAFFITYGVSKLLGTQFIRSGPVLDLTIAEATGFELTWAYFGYSPLYSHAIALGQIVFGGLLLFGRTKRLASLGLMAIVANIVLVNFAYNISTNTRILSVVLLAMNAYLLWVDLPALKRFFWDEAPPIGAHRPRMRTAILTVAALLVGSVAFISFLKAQFMNEGPLHGDWTVEELTVDGQPVQAIPGMTDAWEKVHFDHGGAFGIRTDKGIVHGMFATNDDSTVIVRIDPRSFRRDTQMHDIDEQPFALSVELLFRYALAPGRASATLTGQHDGRQVRLQLRPWVWIRS